MKNLNIFQYLCEVDYLNNNCNKKNIKKVNFI